MVKGEIRIEFRVKYAWWFVPALYLSLAAVKLGLVRSSRASHWLMRAIKITYD